MGAAGRRAFDQVHARGMRFEQQARGAQQIDGPNRRCVPKEDVGLGAAEGLSNHTRRSALAWNQAVRHGVHQGAVATPYDGREIARVARLLQDFHLAGVDLDQEDGGIRGLDLDQRHAPHVGRPPRPICLAVHDGRHRADLTAVGAGREHLGIHAPIFVRLPAYERDLPPIWREVAFDGVGDQLARRSADSRDSE